MTSAPVQKIYAVKMATPPTIKSLYKDKDVLAANPFFGQVYDALFTAVARPSSVTGVKYNRVSSEFWNAAHRVMTHRMTGEAAVADLKRRLERAKRRAW